MIAASTGRTERGSGFKMFKEALSLILIVQVFWPYESQPFLSRSPFTVTAGVGQSVELECHQIYEVELVNRYFWYKQRVGEVPRLFDIPSCNRTDCKFTSKKGHTKYILILEIRNVQVADTGSYYCADRVRYAPLRNGSTLLVGDSSTPKTAVLVFAPPEEPHLRDTVPLVCLVTGVSSNQIAIYWNVAGQVTEGWSDSGTLDPDGTYSITSHVMVPGEAWRSGGVGTCIVELGSKDKSWAKSVSRPSTVAGWCIPTLSIAITVSVILVLVLILISIRNNKRGRSEERIKRLHKESFSLRERMSKVGRNERQSGDTRQMEAKRTYQSAIHGGPPDQVLYASLEFAASEKSSKKKAGPGREPRGCLSDGCGRRPDIERIPQPAGKRLEPRRIPTNI